MSVDLEATIPFLESELGSGAFLESSIPFLVSEIGSGAFLNPSIPALTCLLEADKFSFAGNLTGSIESLSMTAETGVYQEVIGSFGALTAALTGYSNHLVLETTLPFLTASMLTGAGLEASFPELAALLSGSNELLADLETPFPFPTMLSYAGALSEMEIPFLSMTAQATNTAVLTLSFNLPSLNAVITATFKRPISLTTSFPGLTMSGSVFYSAFGSLSTQLPALTSQLHSITGIVATINTYIPFFEDVELTVTSPITVSLSSPLPPLNASIISFTEIDTVLRYIRGQLR